MKTVWFPGWGDAFSNPDTYMVDFLRFAIIVAGAVLIGGVVAIAKRVRNTRQWGLYGFAVATIVVIGTEIQQMGAVATWRIYLTVVFIVLGLVFVYKTYKGDRA